MQSERPDLRHELKLVTDEAAHGEVRMALRLDRAGIRTLHPPRRVQSLYLDTPFHRALEDNLAGLSVREKVRLRWYGGEKESVKARLEHKCRENSMGWKSTLRFEEPTPIAGVERRRFMSELAKRCEPTWRNRLDGLEPAQWVSYLREYYTSADRRVRITLDMGLRFSDQRRLGRLSDAERTPSARLLVLELKCVPENLAHAREILGRLRIPQGRCSKFVLASAPESGPLPSQYEV